jgi:hypothetical protein
MNQLKLLLIYSSVLRTPQLQHCDNVSLIILLRKTA